MSFDAACTIAQMQESASNAPCPAHGTRRDCGWPANDTVPTVPVPSTPEPYVHTGFECGAL